MQMGLNLLVICGASVDADLDIQLPCVGMYQHGWFLNKDTDNLGDHIQFI